MVRIAFHFSMAAEEAEAVLDSERVVGAEALLVLMVTVWRKKRENRPCFAEGKVWKLGLEFVNVMGRNIREQPRRAQQRGYVVFESTVHNLTGEGGNAS
jgi:hypothetical protein